MKSVITYVGRAATAISGEPRGIRRTRSSNTQLTTRLGASGGDI